MTNKTEHERWLDDIEDVIAYISNIDPSHPYIQELLDYEAMIVLADYRGEVVDGIIVEDNLWLDE